MPPSISSSLILTEALHSGHCHHVVALRRLSKRLCILPPQLGQTTGVFSVKMPSLYCPKNSALIKLSFGLSVITNIILLISGEYYAAANGLPFWFTYLFIGFNAVFGLDGRVLGWFSLFVAVNTVPPSVLSLLKDHDPLFFAIWLAWGVLWLPMFVESVLKKDLKNTFPILLIAEGIFAAWIPAWFLLQGIL